MAAKTRNVFFRHCKMRIYYNFGTENKNVMRILYFHFQNYFADVPDFPTFQRIKIKIPL